MMDYLSGLFRIDIQILFLSVFVLSVCLKTQNKSILQIII